MSLQHDYQNFVTYVGRYGCSNWGEPSEHNCGGWILSDFDTWHKCSLHYKDQPHPESYDFEERE